MTNTTTTKKPTKRDNYLAITNILTAASNNGTVLEGYENITFESLIDFINHEVELLDNKATAAQKRAAVKKQEGDALRERVYNHLTDEPQTIAEITKAINDPDVSAQMVTSRLTQLCHEDVGLAIKEITKIPATTEGGKVKKLSTYRRA